MTRSFFSSGVPGMATRALTGNDSGASGSWLISQMRPTRSPSFSPSPMMPPLQTLMPAERTASMVSRRSSNLRVVMTCEWVDEVRLVSLAPRSPAAATQLQLTLG